MLLEKLKLPKHFSLFKSWNRCMKMGHFVLVLNFNVKLIFKELASFQTFGNGVFTVDCIHSYFNVA